VLAHNTLNVPDDYQRGISPDFERELASGVLLPLLERVRHDDCQ